MKTNWYCRLFDLIGGNKYFIAHYFPTSLKKLLLCLRISCLVVAKPKLANFLKIFSQRNHGSNIIITSILFVAEIKTQRTRMLRTFKLKIVWQPLVTKTAGQQLGRNRLQFTNKLWLFPYIKPRMFYERF